MLGQAGPNSIRQVMIYDLGYDLSRTNGRKRTRMISQFGQESLQCGCGTTTTTPL